LVNLAGRETCPYFRLYGTEVWEAEPA